MGNVTTSMLGWNPTGRTGHVTRIVDQDTGKILGEDNDHTRLGQGTRLGKMFAKPVTQPVVARAPEVAVTKAVAPVVEGFACDHPGCTVSAKSKAGLGAHKRSHR